MIGYTDETFRPYRSLTRAEAISVLDRAIGVLYNQKVIDFIIVEEANINFASDYPRVSNIHADRLDLLVKTKEKGKAYYLILPARKDAPGPEQIITGRDASDNLVDSRYYGQLELTADEQIREQIRGLRSATSYQLYLVLEDEKGNLIEVTTIKVTTKRRTSTKPVTIEVTSVALDDKSLTLEVGDEETLVATVLPENATNKAVTWSSSDTDVATVDENGVVTAIAVGTATITVTTVDGSFTDNCTVTVVESEPDTYTVIFKDHDGRVLKTETVEHGKSAIAPADPTRVGYTFSGWDKDFDNVTSDLTVIA